MSTAVSQNQPKNHMCMICLDNVQEQSSDHIQICQFTNDEGKPDGHNYHKDCLFECVVRQALSDKHHNCPTCKQTIDETFVHSIPTLLLDQLKSSNIAALTAYIENKDATPNIVDLPQELQKTITTVQRVVRLGLTNLDNFKTITDSIIDRIIQTCNETLFNQFELDAAEILTSIIEKKKPCEQETAGFLASQLADVDHQEENGSTLMHRAAELGHVITLQALIHVGANINIEDNDKNTPLHLAAEQGHINTLQALINSGAEKEPRDNDGNTPIHVAAIEKKVNTLQALINAGAGKEPRDNEGNTPLHMAAVTGNVEALTILINLGVDKNPRNDLGNTPMHLAALANSDVNLQALINAGANKDAKNKQGKTPLDIACTTMNVEALEAFMNTEKKQETTEEMGYAPPYKRHKPAK